jgi:Cu2+-exporting ATPase
MLIEVGIMLTTYMGVRFYERYRKIQRPQNIKPKPATEIQPVLKNNTQQYQHYYNMGIIAMGLSATRQFIFPQLWLLSLGFYIYTSFPCMRVVEKHLIKKRKVNIDILLFVGDTITLALNQYFAAAFGVFLFYRGKIAVAKAKGYSEKMLFKVFDKQPQKVWILREGVEVEIPFETIEINDIVVANTGEVIPIDGVITEGAATVDQHALTGEAQPVEKEIGSQVFASTTVITGRIGIKVEKSGEDTTIAKIGQILNNSVNYKSDIQLKGEEWANKAVFPTFMIAAFILPVFGPVSTVVFINSHIGNRIRVFASLGTFNHISLASHKSILVKDGRALESLVKIDTILFDKTGTLTNEQPEVRHIISCEQYEDNDILIYAAAAERKFTHPIAKAILKTAKEANLDLPNIEDSQYQLGYGIKVNIKNQIIRVGSTRFMVKEGIEIPKFIKDYQIHSHNEGNSIVLVAIEQQIGGAIEIRPQLRPEVKTVIKGLRKHGIKYIAIVSGDHERPTQKLAEKLGMDNYFCNVLPKDKAQIVEQLQKEGKSVCFIGDGINDAIAMKQACVSISLRGATSIATDMAEVVLMDGSLSHLPSLFDISKDLNNNLQNALKISFMPSAINLSGAFLLHFKILTSLLINASFSTVGLLNASRPLKRINEENKK